MMTTILVVFCLVSMLGMYAHILWMKIKEVSVKKEADLRKINEQKDEEAQRLKNDLDKKIVSIKKLSNKDIGDKLNRLK